MSACVWARDDSKVHGRNRRWWGTNTTVRADLLAVAENLDEVALVEDLGSNTGPPDSRKSPLLGRHDAYQY
jgi:hypothetical protein